MKRGMISTTLDLSKANLANADLRGTAPIQIQKGIAMTYRIEARHTTSATWDPYLVGEGPYNRFDTASDAELVIESLIAQGGGWEELEYRVAELCPDCGRTCAAKVPGCFDLQIECGCRR